MDRNEASRFAKDIVLEVCRTNPNIALNKETATYIAEFIEQLTSKLAAEVD